MNRVATIILNRNLPEPTDRLYEHLLHYDQDHVDIYVLEAGSDPSNLSQYCTWYAKDPQVIKHGLRYLRGMNYALLNLFQDGLWTKYDAFFLLTNDTELNKRETIAPLLNVLDKHKFVGILSPCSRRWGERLLLKQQSTKYFWFIHNHAYFLRKEFIEDLCNNYKPYKINFLFDGSNFRGYGSEIELIAKGYANNWASAITSEMKVQENSTYLISKSQLIKTETYEENFKLYLNEGKKWMKRKYGFNDKWSLNMYSKLFYDNFFEQNPECVKYRL